MGYSYKRSVFRWGRENIVILMWNLLSQRFWELSGIKMRSNEGSQKNPRLAPSPSSLPRQKRSDVARVLHVVHQCYVLHNIA